MFLKKKEKTVNAGKGFAVVVKNFEGVLNPLAVLACALFLVWKQLRHTTLLQLIMHLWRPWWLLVSKELLSVQTSAFKNPMLTHWHKSTQAPPAHVSLISLLRISGYSAAAKVWNWSAQPQAHITARGSLVEDSGVVYKRLSVQFVTLVTIDTHVI